MIYQYPKKGDSKMIKKAQKAEEAECCKIMWLPRGILIISIKVYVCSIIMHTLFNYLNLAIFDVCFINFLLIKKNLLNLS